MFQRLCAWWFNFKGWQMENHMPTDLKKYVITAAPHTSNWDFIYAVGCFHKLRVPVRFGIKDSWMKPPFGGFMRSLGAIGIDRTPKDGSTERLSLTDALANLFGQHDELIVLLTPEGTRSRREKWRTGFYHVAVKAGVPIGIGMLDYKNKVAGVRTLFYPTGDTDADLRKIMELYKDSNARHPADFSVDLDYV